MLWNEEEIVNDKGGRSEMNTTWNVFYVKISTSILGISNEEISIVYLINLREFGLKIQKRS